MNCIKRLILIYNKSVRSIIPISTVKKKLSPIEFIGVGPGDPSLLTLSAVDAIRNATLVAYPISKPGAKSMAATISEKWITSRQKRLPIVLPMVKDLAILKESWLEAADQLAKAYLKGEKVVFLSQGDISLFSTGSYLILFLKSFYPQVSLRMIPGISSFSAAAAAAEWPLSFQKSPLLILPTPDEPRLLEELLLNSEREMVIVLLKLGSRWQWVQPMLRDMDLLKTSIFAQKVGWHDQHIVQADEIEVDEVPYFSLLLIRKAWPEVIS